VVVYLFEERCRILSEEIEEPHRKPQSTCAQICMHRMQNIMYELQSTGCLKV
jgi:hypothetical protein